MAVSRSSTVDGGQHDTKYVTFELLMHAAFVADEIWGVMLEPARTCIIRRRTLPSFRAKSAGGIACFDTMKASGAYRPFGGGHGCKKCGGRVYTRSQGGHAHHESRGMRYEFE